MRFFFVFLGLMYFFVGYLVMAQVIFEDFGVDSMSVPAVESYPQGSGAPERGVEIAECVDMLRYDEFRPNGRGFSLVYDSDRGCPVLAEGAIRRP